MSEQSQETGQAPVAVPAEQSATQAPETASANLPAESKPTEPDAAAEARKAFKGVQKRIDELTRARYEAEERGRQEAEHWRRQAEVAQQQLLAVRGNQPLPRLESYPDVETWAADLAKAQAERIVAERIEQERAVQMQQAQQQQQAVAQQAATMRFQKELDDRVKAAEKQFPGFLDRITSAELPGMVNTPAFTAAWESDNFAGIANFLADHPERAHQIVSLSPVGQVREIARIEAALAAGRAVTGAPPPPDTVGSNANAITDTRRMSDEQWLEWRNKQLATKRNK